MHAYYSTFALDHRHGKLIELIASSEFMVCALVTFLHVASLGLTDTFRSYSRLQPGVPYLVPLSVTLIELVNAVVVCLAVNVIRHIMVTLFMAWNARECEDIAVFFFLGFPIVNLRYAN